MNLSHTEKDFLLTIDALTLERQPCTMEKIAQSVSVVVSPDQARLVCRSLLAKGCLSFVNPAEGETYVELTSIGVIQVKQFIEG